jgi:hypothetical protein
MMIMIGEGRTLLVWHLCACIFHKTAIVCTYTCTSNLCTYVSTHTWNITCFWTHLSEFKTGIRSFSLLFWIWRETVHIWVTVRLTGCPTSSEDVYYYKTRWGMVAHHFLNGIITHASCTGCLSENWWLHDLFFFSLLKGAFLTYVILLAKLEKRASIAGLFPRVKLGACQKCAAHSTETAFWDVMHHSNSL